jgi:hypothetical protein
MYRNIKVEGSSWAKFKYYPNVYLERLRNMRQNGLSLGPALYPEPLNKKQECYAPSCEILLTAIPKAEHTIICNVRSTALLQ